MGLLGQEPPEVGLNQLQAKAELHQDLTEGEIFFPREARVRLVEDVLDKARVTSSVG